MIAEKAKAAKQLKLKSSHVTALQRQWSGCHNPLKGREAKVYVLEEEVRIARSSLILGIPKPHS
jgi:hypothetical protein